jgi:hypothetical protein
MLDHSCWLLEGATAVRRAIGRSSAARRGTPLRVPPAPACAGMTQGGSNKSNMDQVVSKSINTFAFVN